MCHRSSKDALTNILKLFSPRKKWVTDLRTYGPTDQRTNGPTDQRTDTASYRDAWTHLKGSRTKKITQVSKPKSRSLGDIDFLFLQSLLSRYHRQWSWPMAKTHANLILQDQSLTDNLISEQLELLISKFDQVKVWLKDLWLCSDCKNKKSWYS